MDVSTKPNNDDNWNNRAVQFTCKNCLFFVDRGQGLGRCRKHAPTHDGWPTMYESDWCGDHRITKKG